MNSKVMDDSLMACDVIDGETVDSDAREIRVAIESQGDGTDVGIWSRAAAS